MTNQLVGDSWSWPFVVKTLKYFKFRYSRTALPILCFLAAVALVVTINYHDKLPVLSLAEFPRYASLVKAFNTVQTTKKSSRWAQDNPNILAGPWLCAYYSNPRFEGQPETVVEQLEIVSDWQKGTSWADYDGVKELGGKKLDFSVRCATVKFFDQATYSFSGFYHKVAVKITVGDAEDINWSEKTGGWLEPPTVVTMFFPEKGYREVVLEISRGRETGRAWIVFNWVKTGQQHVENDDTTNESTSVVGRKHTTEEMHKFTEVVYDAPRLSQVEAAMCLTLPNCWQPSTRCPNKLQPPSNIQLPNEESEWKICYDWLLPILESPQGCLVYSIGIRNIFEAERAYGALGCQVIALDCTVEHPKNLAPNVTFYSYCLGKEETELQIADGAHTYKNRSEIRAENFITLPELMKKLGHTGRPLTLLKLDCEGCEWDLLSSLVQDHPDIIYNIRMMFLELHFVVNPTKSAKDQVLQMEIVSRALSSYRVARFHWNADVSTERLTQYPILPELRNAGLVCNFFESQFINNVVFEKEDQEKKEKEEKRLLVHHRPQTTPHVFTQRSI